MIENENNISEEEIVASKEEISAEEVFECEPEDISETQAEQNEKTWATRQNNSKVLKVGVAVSVVSSLLSLGMSGYALLAKSNDNKSNSNNQKAESVSDTKDPISISDDGYWVINGVKTTYKAEASDGNNGTNGENGKDAPAIVSATVKSVDPWGIETYIEFVRSDGFIIITTPTIQPLNNHYYEAASKQDIINLVSVYHVSKVKLDADIEFDAELAINSDVEFDLNGHEFNYTPTTPLTVTNGATVKFENGSMNFNASKRWNSSLTVSEGSKLVLNNVEYEAFGSNVMVKGQGSTVEINESSLIGGAYCVATNANETQNFGVNITINESMLEAVGCSTDPMDYDNAPILMNVPGSLNIYGSYIIGDRQTVIVRGGDAIIEDSLIVNTGNYANKTKYLTTNWSEGNEVPMAAIVVGNRSASAYEYDATCKLINSEIHSQNPDVPQVYVYGTENYKAILEYDNNIQNVEIAGKATVKVKWDGSVTTLSSPENNEITISSAAELAGLAEAVNNGTTFKGITIKLACDIDLNNLPWTPIGFGCEEQVTSFRGIFDGQGHVIYNLNVTTFVGGGQGDVENATAGVGLFGNLYLATVKGVHIQNANVYGNHFIGALAGFTSYSHIIDCSVTNATINCEYANSDDTGDKAGALIGILQNSTAKNCNAANSTVSAGRDAGQLIGCKSGNDSKPEPGDAVVENCSATNVQVSANGTGTGANIKNEVIGRQ